MMHLFVPVFKVFGGGDAVWWRMVGPTGREIARSATADGSVDAACGSIAHVVDAIDLFSATLHRTEGLQWRWALALDGEPVVWGVGDHDRFDRCEQACRRFTLLAPLADVDPGEALVGAQRGYATRH